MPVSPPHKKKNILRLILIKNWVILISFFNSPTYYTMGRFDIHANFLVPVFAWFKGFKAEKSVDHKIEVVPSVHYDVNGLVD